MQGDAKHFQEKYEFTNCVEIMDGAVFPLAFKSTEYGEEYWYHKGGYCLHCQLICNDELRVLDFIIGWVVSVHDYRVWSMMVQYQQYHDFFLFTISSCCFGIYN